MKIKESSCDSFNFMKRPFSAAFLGRLFIVMGPTALCAHIVMAYLMVVDRRQRNFRAVTSNIAAKHGGGDHGGLFGASPSRSLPSMPTGRKSASSGYFCWRMRRF